MWRVALASAILGISSLGYPGQALAQSIPGALVIQDNRADSPPAVIIPAASAPQRVISVREGPNLSVIVLPPTEAGSVLPPAAAGSDARLVPIEEPGRLLNLGQGDPPGVLPTYNNNSFGGNGPFS